MLFRILLVYSLFVFNAYAIQLFLDTPGFSLHNKSKKNINVYLKNRDIIGTNVGTPGGPFLVRPGEFLDKFPNLDHETEIFIDRPDGVRLYKAKFTPAKTIYVNWNDKAKIPLYPQRGPKKGKTGHTDKGYDLSDNVQQSDITRLD